jgi:integrase
MKAAAVGGRGVVAEFRDHVQPALMLRVMASGTCVYYATANIRGEGSTRLSIAKANVITLAQARERAAEIASRCALGQPVETDIAKQRRELREAEAAIAAEKEARAAERAAQLYRKQTCFAEIARAYFVHCRRRGLRSAADIERDVERLLVSAWGDRPVTDIRRSDVIATITAIAESGHAAMARNAYALAKALFNWALVSGKMPETSPSPCDRIKIDALVGKQAPRERTLSDPELRLLWAAATKVGHPAGDLVKLLLLTALRLRECAGITAGEIEEGWLHVPARRMKSGKAHSIPLSPAALAIIEAVPENDCGLVFTMPPLACNPLLGRHRPLVGFSAAKDKIDAACVEVAAETQTKPIADRWTFHDLRRTARSRFSAIPNVSDTVRELALAHRPSGIHGVYDHHPYTDELTALFTAWSERLLAIVGGNVVSLPRAGRR